MAWPTIPGSGDLTIDGKFSVASSNNILLNFRANVMSGQGVLALGNAPTIPVSLGSIQGGVVFVQSGHLKYRGSAGTLTTIGSA